MEIIKEYDKDFYAWLMNNARLLREKKFSEIDQEHIAEELESMGKSEKRELISRLSVLLAHLLKWKFQSAKRTKSWQNTITTQRLDIIELLEDSPSLRYEVEDKIEKGYERAKLIAEDETGIDKKNFPKKCPFSFDQILDNEFLPDDKHIAGQ